MRHVALALSVSLGCGGDDCPVNRCSLPDAKIFNDAATRCPRTPVAADRTRFVVVAHPYDSAGNASPSFEVLQLSSSGALTRFSPPRTFMLGERAPFGVIAFTPDAKIGLVPLDDGKVGIFSIDADGNVTVVDPGFAGSFYADRVVTDQGSEGIAWIVDSNTRANGGGVYQVSIDCEGRLLDEGRFFEGSSPGGFAVSGGQAVVAAHDVASPVAGADVHYIDMTRNMIVDGVDAFGDDGAIFSGFAVGAGGVFIGDSNVTGTNRVAIVGGGFGPTVISNITDPSGIAASQTDPLAIVTSSQPPGEGIYILSRDTNNQWGNRGEVTYTGAAPQLPGDVVTIDRGQLAGTVLVSELSQVRRLKFHPGGTVTDEGSLAFGSGLDQIVGAIGVTP